MHQQDLVRQSPGAHPTDVILTKFEIRSKVVVLWFEMFSTDHNEILHMSRQCYCHDVCKILLWWVEYVLNKSITKFHWISNLIEISLVGQVPGDDACNEQEIYHDIMSGVSLGIMYVI